MDSKDVLMIMLHDFEEIIMKKAWQEKNFGLLHKSFPKAAALMSRHALFTISTSAFAFAACIEFILISAITPLAVLLHIRALWFAAFMAYFLHLLVHVGQWMAFRKYIPCIATTLLSLPYCLYAFCVFVSENILSVTEMAAWTGAGLMTTLAVVPLSLSAAQKFDRWLVAYQS